MSEAWENSVGDLFADIDKLEDKKKPAAKKPKKKPAAPKSIPLAEDDALAKPKKKAKSAKPEYRSGLEDFGNNSRQQAQRALGKKPTMAGQFVRRSFTYRPDQLESIEDAAKLLGLSQNDLMRWFVDMGVAAVADGTTPPVAEVVRHRYDPNAGG